MADIKYENKNFNCVNCSSEDNCKYNPETADCNTDKSINFNEENCKFGSETKLFEASDKTNRWLIFSAIVTIAAAAALVYLKKK